MSLTLACPEYTSVFHPCGCNVCHVATAGGEQDVQDAGASGASARDLLRPGALLRGCVTGSSQKHRKTAVHPGQHLHRPRPEGVDTSQTFPPSVILQEAVGFFF